ncbi:hypothetical protein FisN_3Lh370 [Fistulifera solaris]|uniref:JmjC domain-containing protein n=1 Tax=Fistulifera solaris TaxID=1519565 RepID=A0A1Z5J853_FISSO|nr:hypothetical protein FisN_3Lh370 [Fistulifera solaris]|eukprot:GAX10174.1 hypothetical protein FisN_3Lh370 [Fistulifera solaris]
MTKKRKAARLSGSQQTGTSTKQDDRTENSSCCIRVTANRHDDVEESLLQQLLGPLSKDIFMSQYFRSKAVHVKSSVARFQGLMDELSDAERILQETSSESIFVWLPSNQSSKESHIKSIEVSDPGAAYALLQAGHATYCRALSHIEEHLVRRLLQDTQVGCGCQHSALARGEVEVFIGASSEQVTGWHMDFQENFTIQLTGKKQWDLKASTVQHPLRGVTPHYASPEMVEPQLKAARLADPNFQFDHPNERNSVGEIETVILGPGDVLYHPAGIWHRVKVLEPGISINISLMASNYATLVCQSLQHYLLERPAWRQLIQGATPLDGLLAELPDIINQFIRETGTNGILPPVIQEGGIKTTEGEGDNDEMSDNDSETTSVAAVDVEIVDADSFPAHYSLEGFESLVLTINPLASLLDQKEIRKYYHGASEINTLESIKILNVNFAGNENHESLVRVIFRTNHYDIVEQYLKKTDGGLLPREAVPLSNFLIHYGYIIANAGSGDEAMI